MNIRENLGMLLFLLSEAVFFVMLMLSYGYLHNPATALAARSLLDAPRTAAFTAALIASSFTIHLVETRFRRRAAWRGWLLFTIVLGATFLIGQASEYMRLIQQNVTISRDLFGTTFFTLTGFHGLHVTVGLILLSIAFGLSWLRNGEHLQARLLANAGLYWHFVDIVWIAIFTQIYLWPHL